MAKFYWKRCEMRNEARIMKFKLQFVFSSVIVFVVDKIAKKCTILKLIKFSKRCYPKLTSKLKIDISKLRSFELFSEKIVFYLQNALVYKIPKSDLKFQWYHLKARLKSFKKQKSDVQNYL